MSELSPVKRLIVFATLLAGVFAASYGVGAAGEPVDHAPMVEPATGGDHEQHG